MQPLPFCFVHIGAPKTGTTSLQKLFFENRTELARRGLLYPDVSLRGYGHHDLAFLIAGGYPEWATPQPRSLADLTADLAKSVLGHQESLLLSSENFYLLPNPDGLYALLAETKILERYRVRIIVYVRRQDDAHESWFNQTIKAQGCTYDFETYYAQCRDLWDYRIQLGLWERVFGQDAILLRSFEDRQFVGGSLQEDIFALLGVSSEGLIVDAERVNTGLNSDILEFQRLVNRLPMKTVQKRRFHRKLIELSALTSGSGLFNETSPIDSDRRRQLLQTYEESNSAVARQYFGRETLFLEGPREDAGAVVHNGGLDLEKLTYILGWLLSSDDS